jgi:hypothetical protein
MSRPEPWNLLDHPSWAWVAAARLAHETPHETPTILPELSFSTFAMGQEPDVWPVLEQRTAATFWEGVTAGMVALGLLALGWRWRGWVRPLLTAGVRR